MIIALIFLAALALVATSAIIGRRRADAPQPGDRHEVDDGTVIFIGHDAYGAPLYLHQVDSCGRE